METPEDMIPPEGGEIPAEEGEPQFVGEGPIGTIEDEILAEQTNDPENAQHVTVKEQARYDDLVARALLYISDTKPREKGVPSGREATMSMLNDSRKTTPHAIGATTAMTMFMIHNNGKRQGVEYPPDVLFHAADEVVTAVYFMGAAAGIFKDVPKLDPATQLQDYEFNETEDELLATAKMHAVDEFGKLLERTGQITDAQRKEASDYWKQKIDEEAAAGAEVSPQVAEGVDITSEAAVAAPDAAPVEEAMPAEPAPEQAPPDEMIPPEGV